MKIKIRILSILILIIFLLIPAFPGSQPAAQDQPTVKYETGFYYTIQKGDTLWDLSQKFSDTPWQWPEMWNETVKSPIPTKFIQDNASVYIAATALKAMAKKTPLGTRQLRISPS